VSSRGERSGSGTGTRSSSARRSVGRAELPTSIANSKRRSLPCWSAGLAMQPFARQKPPAPSLHRTGFRTTGKMTKRGVGLWSQRVQLLDDSLPRATLSLPKKAGSSTRRRQRVRSASVGHSRAQVATLAACWSAP